VPRPPSVTVSDTAPSSPKAGDLWWDSVGGQLYVWYVDANSSQWVVANNSGGNYLPLTGGALTGPVTAAADPVVPLGLATKQYVDATNSRYRNRIINGDMSVDQRGGSGAIAASGSKYIIDRWAAGVSVGGKCSVGSIAGAPYPFALGWTTTTAYTVTAGDYFNLNQKVEAYNFLDANWGTANAQPVVLEFWAFSSLAGTFGGSLSNGAFNRSYPFTYTLTANTWTKIRLNIPGDTAGTWSVANTANALTVTFGCGVGATYSAAPGSWQAGAFLSATGAVSVVGTLNATLNITGVALMVGAAAANAEPEFRKYSDNLIDCQRYFCSVPFNVSAYTAAGVTVGYAQTLPVMMRAAPTITVSTTGSSNFGAMAVSATSANAVTPSAAGTATGGAYFYGSFKADADF
jgi:hypothetical protein